MQQSIKIRHNVEMAHRLFLTGGRCELIHGHNWDVTLRIFGETNHAGLLNGINFTQAKKLFRQYLDQTFDHRILLNRDDIWAQPVRLRPTDVNGEQELFLPGLQTITGDPTTENFAAHIGEWALEQWVTKLEVVVWETPTNCATWSSDGS